MAGKEKLEADLKGEQEARAKVEQDHAVKRETRVKVMQDCAILEKNLTSERDAHAKKVQGFRL